MPPQVVARSNRMNNATRTRHQNLMQTWLNTAIGLGVLKKIDLPRLTNDGTVSLSGPPLTSWPWGNLGPRLASERSAEGLIFPLNNRSPNGTKLVCKFTFADDINKALLETRIQKILANHKIAAKIYEAYSFSVPIIPADFTAWVRSLNQMARLPNSNQNYVNLFQQFWRMGSKFGNIKRNYNSCVIIVMENLFSNPNSGIVSGKTLREAMADNWRNHIPMQTLRNKITKMHELGVIHGDMHGDNIVVQKIRRANGTYTYGVRIIDFGRSLIFNQAIPSNQQANALLTAYLQANQQTHNRLVAAGLPAKPVLGRYHNGPYWSSHAGTVPASTLSRLGSRHTNGPTTMNIG